MPVPPPPCLCPVTGLSSPSRPRPVLDRSAPVLYHDMVSFATFVVPLLARQLPSRPCPAPGARSIGRYGGIGRHKGLKIPRERSRTGSTPVSGTTSEWTALHSKSPVFDRAFLIMLRHSSSSAKDPACSGCSVACALWGINALAAPLRRYRPFAGHWMHPFRSKLTTSPTPEQGSLCSGVFLCPLQKGGPPPSPSLLLSRRRRSCALRHLSCREAPSHGEGPSLSVGISVVPHHSRKQKVTDATRILPDAIGHFLTGDTSCAYARYGQDGSDASVSPKW